jgi:predicted TIM-barrel fold metal-dependent hydrolase
MDHMQGKIAVEEHFRIEETTGSETRYPGSYWSGLRRKLLEFDGERLTEMDRSGIEMAVISLNSNAIQGIPDVAKATEIARKANDALAHAVAIAETDRLKIGRDNAMALFALG